MEHSVQSLSCMHPHDICVGTESRRVSRRTIAFDKPQRMHYPGTCRAGSRRIQPPDGGTYSSIFGGKSVHTAGILRNAAPDGKIWVSIVVASNHADMNVPGRERVRLQERMDAQGAEFMRAGQMVESG